MGGHHASTINAHRHRPRILYLGIIRACKCGAEWLLVRGKRLSKGHNGPKVSSHRSHSHHPQRSSNKLIAMMHETTQNTYARANEKIRGRGDTLRMFIFPDVSLACLHTPTFSVFAQSKRPRCFFRISCWLILGRQAEYSLFFSLIFFFSVVAVESRVLMMRMRRTRMRGQARSRFVSHCDR